MANKNLLALRLCAHDSNFSFFDGQHVRYLKSERIKSKKHHYYNNFWEWRKDLKNAWGLDFKDVEEIAIVIDPSYYNLPNVVDVSKIAVPYEYFPANVPVWRVNHHAAHALSGWMFSPSNVQIVVDGFGDVQSQHWTVYKDFKFVDCSRDKVSLGMIMGDVGKNLNIEADNQIDIAGKLMGLQSYGKLDTFFYDKLLKYNIKNVNDIFDITHWDKHVKDETVSRLSSLDWIRTVHEYVGDALVCFFSNYADSNDTIYYSGGVAQNVLWNTKLKKSFKNLIIPPHSADEGLSLGALEFLRRKNNLEEFKLTSFPFSQTDESTEEISEEAIDYAAKQLLKGKTVGWYQGNGEIGPRALGHRSILFNPFVKNGKEIINKIKQRENYRPFGCSVLSEYKDQIFLDLPDNPYMVYVSRPIHQIDSVTHVDGTSRAQTVDSSFGSFYKLMKKFHEISGFPLVLNTSLNLAGNPLVGSKKEAIDFFHQTSLDCIFIGDEVYEKGLINQ